MSRTCILVADRSRARFFVLEPRASTSRPGDLSKLREIEALTDADGALKGVDMFSSTRSGTNRSPAGGQFEYDDHRERHRDEAERRFAKRIVEAAKALVHSRATETLVLAAEPRMLGLLRAEVEGAPLGPVELREVPADISKGTPEQIQAALSRRGALPASCR
jgi:protein required for attachment to host cells